MNAVSCKEVNNFYDLNACFSIREDVFVKEQAVDASEEWDDFDRTAIHLIAFLDEKPIGTCRFRKTQNGVKMERFAVLKEARGYQAGAALLKMALEKVLAEGVEGDIYLHAQEHALGFYERYNFKAVGERFFEADIPHFKMVYQLTLGEESRVKS